MRGRFAIAAAAPDLAHQLSLFDTIRRVGGYLFLPGGDADGPVFPGSATYPEGSHLLYAVLDGFVRSSATEFGTGLSALEHFLAYLVAGYGTARARCWPGPRSGWPRRC